MYEDAAFAQAGLRHSSGVTIEDYQPNCPTAQPIIQKYSKGKWFMLLLMAIHFQAMAQLAQWTLPGHKIKVI